MQPATLSEKAEGENVGARESMVGAVDYFPVFMDVRGRRCLVVGGTEAAARKVQLLAAAGARVAVVAADLHAAFEALPHGSLDHLARPFEPADLDDVVLVIAAADDRSQNEEVALAAGVRGLPINVVDDPALCTVIVPAIVDRSPLLIAIGTGGGAPVLARHWRGRIEAHVPVRVRVLAELSAAMRTEVRAVFTDVGSRRQFWEEVFESEVAELALRGERAAAERALRQRLSDAAQARVTRPRGVVYLVGAGPNDPELLSFRALRCLQGADRVLHAPDVASPLVELARRDASRTLLPAWPLADVTGVVQQLAFAVEQGQRVCVLGLGDAFRQGPGQVLVSALQALELPCVIVPGIA